MLRTTAMLIKIRPLYKVRMRQDQAHTRAHDTDGTITQHFLPSILLILVGVELSLCSCHSIPECCYVFWSQGEYRSFVLFI